MVRLSLAPAMEIVSRIAFDPGAVVEIIVGIAVVAPVGNSVDPKRDNGQSGRTAMGNPARGLQKRISEVETTAGGT